MPKDSITQELEPLVIIGSDAGMGEREFEQTQVVRLMPEGFAHELCDIRLHSASPVYPFPIRPPRRALNQVHGSQYEALPSVDQKVTNARPIRSSRGTMPMPPSNS